MMKNKGTLGFLLLIVAIVLWFTVMRGQLTAFSANSLEAEARAREVKSYAERVAQVKKLVEDPNGSIARARLAAFFTALPKDAQVPEVMVMMEQLANSAGVNYNSIGIGTPASNEVPVSVTFSGSINTLNAYTNALYDNVRTVKIKSQSITSDGKGGLTISMQLGLVYQESR